jgi:hypothetical protein
VQRFIVVLEGLPLEEFEEIELPRLPVQGEPIDTRYGTYVVTSTEDVADGSQYAGRIVCSAPG